MQKPFATQPKLFVSGSDPGHPTLHALEDTEALLDWSEIERLLSTIHASTTGRLGHPLLTLLRDLLPGVVPAVRRAVSA